MMSLARLGQEARKAPLLRLGMKGSRNSSLSLAIPPGTKPGRGPASVAPPVDLPAVYAKVQHAASPVHIRKGVALCLLVFERDVHVTLASVFIGVFRLTA